MRPTVALSLSLSLSPSHFLLFVQQKRRKRHDNKHKKNFFMVDGCVHAFAERKCTYKGSAEYFIVRTWAYL